jgi:hypothetical protein
MVDMAFTHHTHVPSGHLGITRRPFSFVGVVAGAALIATAVVAVGSITDSTGPAGVERSNEPAVFDLFGASEPISPLLDGDAFAEAVRATVANSRTPSVLLDGAAFAEAVDAAVTASHTPSILLDGTAFTQAVNFAIGELRTSRSILLDGEAFDAAVTDAIAAARN